MIVLVQNTAWSAKTMLKLLFLFSILKCVNCDTVPHMSKGPWSNYRLGDFILLPLDIKPYVPPSGSILEEYFNLTDKKKNFTILSNIVFFYIQGILLCLVSLEGRCKRIHFHVGIHYFLRHTKHTKTLQIL